MTGNGGYLTGQNGIITKDFNGTTDFAEAFVKLKYSENPAGMGAKNRRDGN